MWGVVFLQLHIMYFEYVWVTGVQAIHVCAKFSQTYIEVWLLVGAVAKPPLHKPPLACAREWRDMTSAATSNIDIIYIYIYVYLLTTLYIYIYICQVRHL